LDGPDALLSNVGDGVAVGLERTTEGTAVVLPAGRLVGSAPDEHAPINRVTRTESSERRMDYPSGHRQPRGKLCPVVDLLTGLASVLCQCRTLDARLVFLPIGIVCTAVDGSSWFGKPVTG
jgi:hypothetical protein